MKIRKEIVLMKLNEETNTNKVTRSEICRIIDKRFPRCHMTPEDYWFIHHAADTLENFAEDALERGDMLIANIFYVESKKIRCYIEENNKKNIKEK